MRHKLPPKKVFGRPESHCAGGGAHHYLIAEPNGKTSPGRCRKCGNEREFENSGWEMAVGDLYAWRDR